MHRKGEFVLSAAFHFYNKMLLNHCVFDIEEFSETNRGLKESKDGIL